MSTNSTITIKRIDGTETGIYCHHDGYIEGVGVTLQLAYNTAEKVEELLKLGDLSTLGYYTEPKAGTVHDFEHPQESVCVAYHRDRGEEYRQSNGDNEYIYTFDERDCVWYVEEEQSIRNTAAQNILYLGTIWTHKKSLLLDALADRDFRSLWRDDEFAAADNVFEVCKQKAYEARAEIIKKNAEEYNAYYSAYCD